MALHITSTGQSVGRLNERGAMYLSSDVLSKAFNALQAIEKNPEGKLRQEKVSALSYLLATSELLKRHGKIELNLAPSESAIREEFKNSVAEFKEILGAEQFSVDFNRKFESDVAGSVSSNFLTTVVSQSKNLNDYKNYPSRSNNSALLSILKEKISIHPEFNKNLYNYYNFAQIKTSLALWISKKSISQKIRKFRTN